MKKINISKSSFMRGRQCHKALWLHKHRPELAPQESVSRDARKYEGTAIGKLACGLFPGGYEVPTDDWDNTDFNELLDLTDKYIEAGDAPIYEATISAAGVFVMVDILVPTEKGWEIYEVKGSTEVKSHHCHDAAIQYYALKKAGLEISGVFIVHINNEYVRQGELDIRQLFTMADVSDEMMNLQTEIPGELEEMQKTLQDGEPDIAIGLHCEKPYKCDFREYCWKHVPENSVLDITGRGKEERFGLCEKGVVAIADLPDDFSLTREQQIQVEGVKTGKRVVNKDALSRFLNTLRYPLCFLDFETWGPAVPPFDNAKPYGLIPTQYSLHVLNSEEGKLRHYEYLADGRDDPRAQLTRRLVGQIPDDSCILVYNKNFEIRVLNALEQACPDYADAVATIRDNIQDLMRPFCDKDYYTPPMKGRYSIKYVLPALVPGMQYEGEVADGNAAMYAFAVLRETGDPIEREKLRRALLEYCKQDTLAMVRILEKVREAATSD